VVVLLAAQHAEQLADNATALSATTCHAGNVIDDAAVFVLVQHVGEAAEGSTTGCARLLAGSTEHVANRTRRAARSRCAATQESAEHAGRSASTTAAEEATKHAPETTSATCTAAHQASEHAGKSLCARGDTVTAGPARRAKHERGKHAEQASRLRFVEAGIGSDLTVYGVSVGAQQLADHFRSLCAASTQHAIEIVKIGAVVIAKGLGEMCPILRMFSRCFQFAEELRQCRANPLLGTFGRRAQLRSDFGNGVATEGTTEKIFDTGHVVTPCRCPYMRSNGDSA
jgi:hypothetical protein